MLGSAGQEVAGEVDEGGEVQAAGDLDHVQAIEQLAIPGEPRRRSGSKTPRSLA
jgi:hypothetical protein